MGVQMDVLMNARTNLVHSVLYFFFYFFHQVLTDVLELRVPEEDGNIAQRNQYKYEQLHDLQSSLMLVAGKAEKGKDDVDRFMLVYVYFYMPVFRVDILWFHIVFQFIWHKHVAQIDFLKTLWY